MKSTQNNPPTILVLWEVAPFCVDPRDRIIKKESDKEYHEEAQNLAKSATSPHQSWYWKVQFSSQTKY